MIKKIAKKKDKKGFTILELVIVMAIIGLLAAIAIPQFFRFRQKAYMTATKSDVKNAHIALQNYISENISISIPAVSATGPTVLGIPYESSRVSNHVTVAVDTDGSVTGTHSDYTGYMYKIDANGAPIETIP